MKKNYSPQDKVIHKSSKRLVIQKFNRNFLMKYLLKLFHGRPWLYKTALIFQIIYENKRS